MEPRTLDREAALPPPENQLVVRRLTVDLSLPIRRHWNGDDAFRTAFANALSMSFPVGEQFFIDSVRAGVAHLPAQASHELLRETAQNFIGQEATHRHLHGLFNAQLERQGLVNTWAARAQRRLDAIRALRARRRTRRPYLHDLAVTAAYEHYTAILGDLTLTLADQPGDWFAGADPRLRLLWQWHAAEETEHKAVAFDLYRALGGNHAWRVRWFLFVTLIFALDVTRQTLRNLWNDGSWWRLGVWGSAARFFFGRGGAFWCSIRPIAAYFRRDFHPDRLGDGQIARQWLSAHGDQYSVVGAGQRPVA